jgi:transmembrane sensor
MKYPVTPELLHKYVDGQCTAEETAMLHQWYDSFEDEEDPFETLSGTEQEALKMLMLDNFKASIKTSDDRPDDAEPERNRPVKLLYTLSGIAALLLMVWGIYFGKKTLVHNANAVITTASAEMVLNNETNSIYRQVLSDGSVVWLSPKSQLEYPKKFTGTYRQVKMTGEAFFEVTKNHSHPFIIYSGGVVTRVWGTSFRIRAYQDVPTEVSVLTGKVSVKLPEKDNSEVMLYPQQEVTYLKEKAILKKGTGNKMSSMRMWQKTNLSFDNVRFGNVINTLDDKFGVHIYTDDEELSEYLLKADFTDQSLPAILEMLQNSLDVSYTIDNTEIVISRKSTN